ncbi:3-deoxy-D-manno-octulosonic-acid transferase [Lutibacter oricola]|uniref:3-deoxy-D-manno-octulosonic acid transferase n=1 Tax=Lutibacter oricola TaxID=762486 RepID=A0A1H2S1T9_9FLAO|nr:glycosyltransferase N-terminal domain-containing protein [Lutibacter oricola]SDW25571.1 3-deoxy-D-manno-octulosonic-acid transferase [Lutibacter oricola]
MYFLYNIIVLIVTGLLKIVALFNKKIQLFVEGRNQTFNRLKESISKNDEVIWVHCASLGEFEQGRPIIEKLKVEFPSKKIVLTFFSPSGYEVRKDYNVVDIVCYLPLDSKSNAKKFLDIVHPEKAIFVKYEFWPNLLRELKQREVNTILVSGIFRENQAFFKSYGSWMRNSLKAFSHFFVQNKVSESLLKNVGFNNVTLCGDTRFDRVYEITQQNNKLNFIEEFTANNHILVAGSSWKEDEDLLVEYINNNSKEGEKFIIAPHNIKPTEIEELKNSITKKVVSFSEKETKNLNNYQVFIIDTVGILTKIYSYAHVAYVGGGYTKSGVHNVLEPACYGVPVLIGPNYQKFNEAIELVDNGGCFVVDSSEKLSLHLKKFYNDNEERKNVGQKSLNYVASKTGATLKILNYLKK